MKARLLLTIALPMMTITTTSAIAAECYGSGEYQVCSETYTDSRGNVQIRSWDSQGNTYSVGSEVVRGPGNSTEVRSSDSMGNSYRVRSWTDSQGTHSVDSMGNRCTITRTGKIIGCGQ